MVRWYFSVQGDSSGPFDHETAVIFAGDNPHALCWRPGFSDWRRVSDVSELNGGFDQQTSPTYPPPVKPTGSRLADEIDYTISGQEMQYVEVELDPGESAVAEAGAMMYKDAAVTMTTVFGDGSEAQATGSFMNKLIGAGKRLITGDSLFTTVFTHQGHGKAKVAFGAPFPGTILPIHLTDVNGRLICQKDSFLAAAKGVSIGVHFQKKIMTGLFGGEGFIMQTLEGDGWVFVHMGGTLAKRDLAPGETLHVDTGCLAALTDTVDYDIVRAGGVKTILFGGEGVFLATLTGPGSVWLQSLPFSRLAGRMLSAAGGDQGEGSILGGVGNVLEMTYR